LRFQAFVCFLLRCGKGAHVLPGLRDVPSGFYYQAHALVDKIADCGDLLVMLVEPLFFRHTFTIALGRPQIKLL
jgi:hypothetical protein